MMSDTYVSREEMEELFDGLASDSRLTRTQFDAHLHALRPPPATEDHLTFMEADDLESLTPERGAHMNDCGYCKRLVEMLCQPPDFSAVDRMVEEDLSTRRRSLFDRYRFIIAPACTIAGVFIGVAVKGTPPAPAVVNAFDNAALRTIAAPVHLASIRTTMPILTARVRQEFLDPSAAEPRALKLGLAGDQFFSPDVRGNVQLTKEQFFRENVPYGAIIYREAKRNDLPPELVAAMVHSDSDFRPRLVSAKSAVGLMQIVPEVTRLMGTTDPFDPEENIAAGTRYYRYLLERFDNERIALAAYNAGESNVERFGGVPPFEDTRQYIEKVEARASRYRQRMLLSTVTSGRGRVALVRDEATRVEVP